MAAGDRNSYDVAIVGGGPAGLSAGIWLARYLHSVVLIDSGDPRNWETRGVNAYLGLPKIRPAELRRLGREECRAYGVQLVDAHVEHAMRCTDDRFVLQLGEGTRYDARRLLLAIGLKDVWPDVPGLEPCYGETAHVCPDCDGYEARGKSVVVIGTGRKAVGMALALSTWSSNIVICTNGLDPDISPALGRKLDAIRIPVMTAGIAAAHSRGGSLEAIELENGSQLRCQKIFFSIAQYPADDLGEQLGCERDEDGHITVDEAYHTSVRNVFAAGDIVPGPQLAITAASDGAIAALAIHKSLVPEERKL